MVEYFISVMRLHFSHENDTYSWCTFDLWYYILLSARSITFSYQRDVLMDPSLMTGGRGGGYKKGKLRVQNFVRPSLKKG